jgi:hypothetical protein
VFSFAVAVLAGSALLLANDAGRGKAGSSSSSLVTKLVGPERHSPLVLHRGPGVQIGVSRAGMLARNRGAQLALELQGSNVGPWVRHATGAIRHTSFGSEVVRFGLPASEEYLVVDRHVGTKTYSWKLGGGVRPTLEGRSIHLSAGGRPLNLTLSSPRILDLSGRDVTPTGVGWKIGRDHGHWLLKLRLDDKSLPTQYIIDPVLTFRSIAVAQFNAATSATVTLPANTAAGDLLIVSLSINTTSSSAFALSPSSTSIACGGGGTLFDSTSAAAHITQNLWWAVAGAGDAGKTCVATWSGAGEVVMYVVDYTTGTYFTSHPVDFAGNGGTSASTTYTSNDLSTFFYSEFLAMAATEDANKNPGAPTPGTWTAQSATVGQTYINTSGAIKVGVVYYDGATRATAGSGTVTGTASLANNTIASVFGLRQDDATSPAVSVATPANTAKINNGASLTSTLTDETGGSGPQKVEYYYCVGNVTCNAGAGGPALIGSSTTGPTYPVTWNGQPADGTYTVFAKGFDNAGNATSSSSVVVTVDNTAPTFTSAALSGVSPSANMYLGSITGLGTGTASGSLYYKGNVGSGGSFKLQVGVADATSGLASLSFPALTGTTTGWTHTAPDAPGVTGASAGATSVNSFSYSSGTTSAPVETAAVTDASGNTGSLALTMTNDPTAPSGVSITSPSGGASVSSGQVLTAGAADAGSGVKNVSYYYCAGAVPTCNSTTGSPTLIGTSATATSYSVTWSSLPPAGSYKLFAAATDNVGNSTDSSSISISISAGAASQLAFTSQPAGAAVGSAFAGQPVVAVEDGGGNTVTAGPDSTVDVTIAIQSGSGSLLGTVTKTAVGGVATFTNLRIDTIGAYTLRASTTLNAGAVHADSGSFTVVPGPPSKLVITSSTGSLTSGSTRDITAVIEDAAGNVITSDSSTSVSFSQTGGAGSVSGTGAATVSSGIATKTVTSVLAGPVTITAHSGSLADDTTTFTIVPGAASKLAITSSTTNLISGSTRDIVAQVEDAAGNVLTSDNSTSISITQTGGTGTTGGTGSATASSGVATKTVTGILAGTVTITAHSGSLADDTTTFTIVPGAAAKLAITSSTANLSSGSTRDITAAIEDTAGNVVTSDSSTSIGFTKTSGSGSASGTGSATASSGAATKTVTGVLAGPVTITAHSGSLTDDTTTFTIVPGAPAKLAITSSTGNLSSGATRDITAQVEDAAGNVVTSDNSTGINITQTSGTGTISGTGSAIASGGIATKTVTGILAGTVTITAHSGSLTDDTTTFTIVPGAAAKLAITSSTADLTSGSTRDITAQVEDAAGNVLTSDNSTGIAITQTSGTGTTSGTGSATASSGTATKTVTGVLAGTVTITAHSGSLTDDTTTFTIVPGAAAKLTITSPTADLTSGSTRDITAAVEDAAGNVVASDSSTSVTVSQSSGAGTISGTGSATASSGIATDTVTGVLVGNVTLTAHSGSLTDDTTTFTVVPGSAAKLAITSPTGDLAIGATRDITAQVEDAAGNVITSDNSTAIDFSQTSGAGAVTGTGSATAASGVATRTAIASGVGSVTLTAHSGSLTDDTTTFLVVATDTTPPSKTSAAVTGAALKIHFDESLDTGSVPAGTAFAVTVNGNPVTVTNVSIAGSIVTLTLSPAVGYGDSVSVTYTPPPTNKLRDGFANNTTTFTTGVTNNSADSSAPTTVVQFPADGASYNTAGWAANSCSGSPGASRICGTVSDSGSGVQKVQVSLRDGTGNYYDGSAFSSASEIYLLANGTSNWSYALPAGKLADGHTYTLQIKGTDNSTNVEPAQTVAFTFDTSGPAAPAITGGPGTTTTSTTATFPFTSGDPTATFQCSVDGGTYASCASPLTLTGLAVTAHTFSVRASDLAGNVGPAATYAWTISPAQTLPPHLLSTSPADGSTISAIGPTITADRAVTWTSVVLQHAGEAPVGLSGASAQTTLTIPFSATAGGLYTITATISDGVHAPVNLVWHTTIWTAPPSEPDAPPTGHTAYSAAATGSVTGGSLTSSDRMGTVQWPAGDVASDGMIVEIDPVLATPPAGSIFTTGGAPLDVTAHHLSDHTPITSFSEPLIIHFPNAGTSDIAATSTDGGATWRRLTELAAPSLATGQLDGFFRLPGGGLDVYTLHLTLYALLTNTTATAAVSTSTVIPPSPAISAAPTLQTPLSLRVTGSKHIDTTTRRYAAVRVQLSVGAAITATLTTERHMPVTSWTTRSVKPGTSILRYALPKNLASGKYKLTVEAKHGLERQAFTIRVHLTKGKFNVLGNRKVVLVGGDSLPDARAIKLEPRAKIVTTSSTTVFDRSFLARNVAVVVVDVDRDGVRTVHNLHILFPTVKLVAVTTKSSTADRARRYGATTVVLSSHPTGKLVGSSIDLLLGR